MKRDEVKEGARTPGCLVRRNPSYRLNHSATIASEIELHESICLIIYHLNPILCHPRFFTLLSLSLSLYFHIHHRNWLSR